jgi:Rhodopirellula transposase DDE domain
MSGNCQQSRCRIGQVILRQLLSKQLKETGHKACPHTVRDLLKRQGFSLKGNERKQGQSRSDCPERDEQFRYVASKREAFKAAGWPIISVDTKKKELVGNFRRPGKTWCKKPPEVNEHDYSSQAECLTVPFGIYDVMKNTGYVVVGLSHNTSEFAVSSISRWWQDEGQEVYPGVAELLILADGGGGNGYRSKAWRWNLQEKICNRYRLTVTVCHYPPGCSKWNPVEHRLFSQISNNWAGTPLRSLAIMLGYIRGTTTTTGLSVKAVLDEGIYPKGQKVTWKDVDALNLTPHEVCPEWNYTIRPSE